MVGSQGAAAIPGLLQAGAAEAPAILGEDGEVLSYAGLRAQVASLGRQLWASGIGPADRVAIVLPNGPVLAVTVLGVMAHAAAAPLNPAYTTEEYRFFLEDMDARALITLPGDAEAARIAAPHAVHCVLQGGLGSLTLDGPSNPPPSGNGGTPGDTALVLHTSGTTARPKLVPLTHRNLATSAGNVAASLALTPADRCLNVMPLFHIHGLVAALLSTLYAGASVACSGGFNALRVYRWLEHLRPTWFTAVPTMYQAILSRPHPDGGISAPLRFARSSSAPLPPTVMAAFEKRFGIPLIEAYGMTEASHQISANPLPPAERKPGSVGVAAAVDVAVMADGRVTSDERVVGEVVIRGDNVTAGYAANPDANAEAFCDGWFRTGDEGFIENGYLHLTDRLKEVINRGGEKVSPREVDEVLLAHPAVDQALTFAVPHRLLGEEVAVAVVVKDGAASSVSALRTFAASRLAPFKVPKAVVFLEEIPTGPTGKLQRIGLADRLGLGAQP